MRYISGPNLQLQLVPVPCPSYDPLTARLRVAMRRCAVISAKNINIDKTPDFEAYVKGAPLALTRQRAPQPRETTATPQRTFTQLRPWRTHLRDMHTIHSIPTLSSQSRGGRWVCVGAQWRCAARTAW